MASLRLLPTEILANLAAQAATVLPYLPSFDALGAGAEVSINESLEIWHLTAASVLTGQSLEAIAVNTGRWHHQIFCQEQAIGALISAPSGPLPIDWKLLSTIESTLPLRIQQAMLTVDQSNLDDGYVARLIEAPAHLSSALWLFSEEKPSYIVPLSGVIATEALQLLPEAMYLALLRNAPVAFGFSM